jgi:subfamily B ATP-binding cassette protein MsbA
MKRAELTKVSVWDWFVRAVRRYPGRSAVLVLLSILNSLADGLSVSLLIPFLALLFQQQSAALNDTGLLSSALQLITATFGTGRELMAVSGLIVALVAFRNLAGYVESLIASWISGQIGADIRSRIHDNLLKVDYEFICVNDNGRLLNTLDDQAWRAAGAVSSCFGLIASALMALVFLVLLVLISWQVTLLVAVLVFAVSLFMMIFDRRMRALGVQSVSAAEVLSERAVELLDVMRMTRAFGREKQAQSAYDSASRRLFGLSMSTEKVGGLAGAVQEILYALNFIIVIFFALSIDLGGAALIGYLALLYRLQPHVRAIDGARMELASVAGSLDAVAKVLELAIVPANSGPALRLDAVAREIRFDRVSFAYEGKDAETRDALADVSLSFPIGKVTAVVGWSGAGKSTLINLLYRFHDPLSGTISVDGTPLNQLDLQWWRSQLAIAGQDAELINGSLFDNIAYGREDAGMAEVVDAARRAQIHDFIAGLPRGYDTQIGGRGLLLSGGERQRIGLARALVRRSRILILDEATNSIDSLTEAGILASLEALGSGMTIIVVAHRVSSTRTAEQVIAMANGRVIEAGSPQALISRGGFYAQMVDLQQLEERSRRSRPA